MSSFHPERSRVSADTMGEWLRKVITGDLLEVPGVGPASVTAFKNNDITTTYQLFGKFLSLKDEGVGSVEHCERFYLWLNSVGTAPGTRGAVVLAVAEKLNMSFTGLYDASMYESTEDA